MREEIKRKDKNKKQRGITLIALVITIIVLLILAGVSIAMLTGENGILTQAQKAKNETEQATENEAAILDEYNKYLNNAVGEITIPEGLEIGSEVSYSPEGNYNWDVDYYYSGDETYEDIPLNTSDTNYAITKWKVLDINKENGTVKLVPTSPTIGTVRLGGAQGYNNAVKLLNDACSNLYGYGGQKAGVSARSINIEDIEHYMTDTALGEAHNSIYNTQIGSAYSKSYSYYPLIYAEEEKSVIDGREKETGLKMSEQSEFINDTENTGTARGRRQANTSIHPYHTYWTKNNTFMQTAFKDFSEVESSAEGNFYDLIVKGTKYWVASRCVNAYQGGCHFRVYFVYQLVESYAMYASNTGDGYGDCALFPVVSVSSELVEGDSTAGYTVNVK